MPLSKQVGSVAESRTRVTCHLPVGTAGEEKAAIEVIAFIRQQKDNGVGVSGYHHSAAFNGAWWSDKHSTWVADQIYVIVVDYKIGLANPEHALFDIVMALKQFVMKAYRSHGSRQEEVWITSEKLTLYR